MEEPKALLPNGHSESHSDETPQPMEVDNEPDVKPDIKIEVKRSKSLDTPIAADDASDSSAPAHNPSNESDQSQASDASSASKESAAEPPPPPSSSSSSSSEKSAASKKKVPQKILKRSPRISRNREPSEDESSNKAEDEKLKLESIVEEKAEKESDESEKKRSTSVEEVNKDETEKGTKEETNKEISVKKEKVDDSKMDEHMEPHTSGFSEEVFLGFEDKAESYNKLNRDTICQMIDAITASTPGQSRSRRSVKRDVVSKDVENKKDSEKAKSDKKEAETAKDEVKKENKEHLSDWFDRKIQERLSPHPNYYANDEDYDSGGVSNDILIPEVVYMTGPGSHSSAKDGDASKRSSTPATSQSSKKRRRAREKGGGSRRNYDVSLPQFLKPFEYGWKREIVYRNNSETYSKRIGDVYYHTPLGKKIRSIGLVKDYLLGTDLTLENFTFVVKPIVSDDPTKEFISRSKPKLEKEAETPPPLPKRGAALAAASSLKSATKSGNGGPEAGDAAKVETSIDKNSAVESSSSSSSSSLPASSSSPKPSLNSTPKIAFRSFKSSPKPKPTKQLMPEKKGKKYSEDENEKEELEMGMLPPLWKSPTHSDWSANGGSTMELTSSAKSEKGRKRQLEETDAGTPPPAKQAKVDSTDATDRTPTPTLTPPDAANATPEATPKTPPTTEAALPTPSPDVAAVKSENVEAVTSQKSVTAVTSQKSVAAVTSQKSVGVGVTSQAFPPHPAPSSSVSVNKEFFMTNVSAIYHALLNSFQYLNVQELLRAARVCHMWRDVALNRSLWHVVRMKNSRVRDWDGFASTLRSVGAKQLDLRKMLVPDRGEEVGRMWREYARAIHQVNSLYRLDLCRCPSHAIEQSLKASPRLQYLSALAIKSSSLDAAAFENCKNLTELRFKCSEKGGLELENVASLKNLTKMKHLSLTTMKSFPPEFGEVLENMKDLETLELGECTSLSKSVALSLSKLKGLQRLRLEKGQGSDCPTITILESIRDLESLKQLELINFDIKAGFDETISKCIHLRTLLIIPTYVTQSATTNHVVMEGVSKLAKTLTLFVWGITLELLKVTDLFIDQWEGQKGANKGAANPAKKGSGDSIPILKPIAENNSKEIDAPSQVDILQLPKLHKVLTSLLPTTKVKILKVPFAATWRQTVSGPAHIH